MTVGLKSILLSYATGYRGTRYAFDLMSKGTGYYTRRILNYLDQNEFDVLVSDFALPASHIAAEITGIPCAIVFHCGLPFKGDGIPPFESGLSIGDPSSTLYEECFRVEKRFGRLDKTDGAKTASKLIQRLAETKKPLKRPSSIPLTITVDGCASLGAIRGVA